MARRRHNPRLLMLSRAAAITITKIPANTGQHIQLGGRCKAWARNAAPQSKAPTAQANEPNKEIGGPPPPLPQRIGPRHFGQNAETTNQHATRPHTPRPIKQPTGPNDSSFPLPNASIRVRWPTYRSSPTAAGNARSVARVADKLPGPSDGQAGWRFDAAHLLGGPAVACIRAHSRNRMHHRTEPMTAPIKMLRPIWRLCLVFRANRKLA